VAVAVDLADLVDLDQLQAVAVAQVMQHLVLVDLVEHQVFTLLELVHPQQVLWVAVAVVQGS
jgi:hypothetical protein